MFFNLLLVSLLGFFPRKLLYKSTIYTYYREYKSCYNNINNKDPHLSSYLESYSLDDWNKLSDETKQCILKSSQRQTEIVEEMVSLVKLYCKLYPNEKICKHCNFKTYDEYPYRLPQTLPEFIRLL